MLTSRPKFTSNDVHTQVFDCPIAFIGESASELLTRRGLAGTVIASFSQSCWLETPGGRLFAIADQKSGEGPLTIGVVLPERLTLADLGIEQGTELVADGVNFLLGDRLILRISATALWHPATLGPRASNEEVARRLWALIDSVTANAPAEGLAPLMGYLRQLVNGSVTEAVDLGIVSRFAMPKVALLAEGIAHGDREAVDQAVRGLIGLGPGLTPSGDDMLVGLMVSLRTALGPVACNEATSAGLSQSSCVPVVDALSHSTVRHATCTNRISAALLEQAALGIGSAAQHQVVQCLLEAMTATALETAVAELVRWGHTSGWDSLTGILFGVAISLRLAKSTVPEAGNVPRVGAGV